MHRQLIIDLRLPLWEAFDLEIAATMIVWRLDVVFKTESYLVWGQLKLDASLVFDSYVRACADMVFVDGVALKLFFDQKRWLPWFQGRVPYILGLHHIRG